MEQKKNNIYQRILGVMTDIDYIQKGDKMVNGQYRFVGHDQVTAKIHPALVKHGIVCVPSVYKMEQDGNRTSVDLVVTFVNVDEPTDTVQIRSWGYGIDTGDKGPGKAVSYAFKYAILKLFCLETGDDPDMDANAKFEPLKKESDLGDLLIQIFAKVPESSVDKYPPFASLYSYIKQLEKDRNVPKLTIAEQALQPQLSERFLKSWVTWHAGLPKS